MPLIQDIKNDIREAKRIRIPWWGVLLWMAGCGLIDWLLISLGKFDLALPALNSIAVVGFTIALKRKLGRHVWFWITMAVLAALHVPLVLFVPWTTRWVPALAIAVIDSADFCLMLWIISIVGKLVEGPKAAGDERPRPSIVN
jgi:hypothetical protein